MLYTIFQAQVDVCWYWQLRLGDILIADDVGIPSYLKVDFHSMRPPPWIGSRYSYLLYKGRKEKIPTAP